MNNLRSIRQQKQLSLAAVAVRARSGIGTLIMVEKYGYFTSRRETRARIARGVGATVKEVWPGDHPHTPSAA